MSSIPAGWYPDPEYPRQPWTNEAQIPKRYFDGTAWTDDIELPAPTSPGNTGRDDAWGILLPMLFVGGILAVGTIIFAVYF